MTTEAIDSFGTEIQVAHTVAAYLVTGSGNFAIRWVAAAEGTAGNSITVTLVNPGGTAALAVSVAGTAITVNLETLVGALQSTANEVMTAVQNHPAASALVCVESNGSSTGDGIVAAASVASLANGSAVETYTPIAELLDIDGPDITRAKHNATNHDSPADSDEWVIGMLTLGDVAFDVNFRPTNDTHDPISGLQHDVRYGTLRKIKLIMTIDESTTKLWEFNAYITDVKTKEPVDGLIGGSITLTPTGEPTLT